MNSSEWAKLRAMIQAATGVKHTHRFRKMLQALNGSGTNGGLNTFPLLAADDDPDYDVGGDLSTVMECETNSRITGMDLTMYLKPGASGSAVEWVLWKDPDAIFGNANTVSPADLFANDLNADRALLRKYIMAYGVFVSSSSAEQSRIHVRISRAALRRAGVMQDTDVIRLNTLNSHSSTGLLSFVGRIWTRK